MEKIKNPKVIYLVAILIIIVGICVTCIWKTNFSLLYKEHTRIDVYIGKEYQQKELEQIVKEVLEKEAIKYQEIETFHDSVAIHVGQISEEQLTSLKEKLKEKYQIEEIDNAVTTTNIPHYRIRDIVKPYIIPMIITTIIILAYVGIRYLNIGIFKVIFTLFIRMIVAEAVLASMIEIVRIPVGPYTIPIAILVYILVTIVTVVGYENEAGRKKEEENKK